MEWSVAGDANEQTREAATQPDTAILICRVPYASFLGAGLGLLADCQRSSDRLFWDDGGMHGKPGLARRC